MARDDPHRPGLVLPRQPRKGGRFQSNAPAIERFAAKCAFDPVTGCVIWVGGKTSGRGNSAEYGSFWDAGKRHFAHRWAAENIHGHDIAGAQVGHCCPAGPNTLCVEHVEPQTQADNLAEMHERRAAGVRQSNEERQYWLFVSLGIEPEPEPAPRPDGFDVPWYDPPEWLRPYLPQPEAVDDGCPF